MTGSSIPAAHANLVAKMQAATATGQPLAGVKVLDTGLWDTSKSREYVVALPAADITQEWRNMGSGISSRIDERYTLPVLIEIYRSGNHIPAMRQRLWELAAGVYKTALQPDGTLSGAIQYLTPSGAPAGEEIGPSDEDTMIARVTLNLDCFAQVRLA